MHKLRYMALGGLLMFIGMLTASVLMPSLVAQRDKFGAIECTSLRVIDEAGNSRIILTTNIFESTADDNIKVRVVGNDLGGGAVVAIGGTFAGKDSLASLRVDGRGGRVEAYGKDGGMVSMGMDINNLGGRIVVSGNDVGPKVSLNVNKLGGQVIVRGNNGESKGVLGIGEAGGHVGVFANNEEGPQALFGVDENGDGYIGVLDKNGESKVGLGIDEHGNGAVSTWDKNGYRQ